ncbi:MAG: E3 binding domain-containing protein, partial [Gaiellaceae bacterium]
MATEIKLPRLGQGMESGTIVKWLKSEGEQVQKGEALYELDTDKVTQEVEAEASGVLLRIAIPDGEVEVGKTIAFIGDKDEELAESPEGDSAKATAPAAEPKASAVPAAATNGSSQGRAVDAEPPQQESGGRIKASPLARRIARERGIELSQVRGTGPEGRIVAEDVERAVVQPAAAGSAAAMPAGAIESRPLSNV